MKMSMKMAKRVQELRAGERTHSWRALAEVICKEFPEAELGLSGNQLYGEDLCKEAAEKLKVSKEDYERHWQ